MFHFIHFLRLCVCKFEQLHLGNSVLDDDEAWITRMSQKNRTTTTPHLRFHCHLKCAVGIVWGGKFFCKTGVFSFVQRRPRQPQLKVKVK